MDFSEWVVELEWYSYWNVTYLIIVTLALKSALLLLGITKYSTLPKSLICKSFYYCDQCRQIISPNGLVSSKDQQTGQLINFVWLLSANHRCVLWPVDQWECLIFVALNLWAFHIKPWFQVNFPGSRVIIKNEDKL